MKLDFLILGGTVFLGSCIALNLYMNNTDGHYWYLFVWMTWVGMYIAAYGAYTTRIISNSVPQNPVQESK